MIEKDEISDESDKREFWRIRRMRGLVRALAACAVSIEEEIRTIQDYNKAVEELDEATKEIGG